MITPAEHEARRRRTAERVEQMVAGLEQQAISFGSNFYRDEATTLIEQALREEAAHERTWHRQQIEQLIKRIHEWLGDGEAGYDLAIELLCDIEKELTTLLEDGQNG